MYYRSTVIHCQFTQLVHFGAAPTSPTRGSSTALTQGLFQERDLLLGRARQRSEPRSYYPKFAPGLARFRRYWYLNKANATNMPGLYI